MYALLKEQEIWAPLFDQPSKVDKLILELQDKKDHSLILLLSYEVLYKVSEEKTTYVLRRSE